MPESETAYIDYYSAGWTEQVHEERYVEWVYDDDPELFVRLDGTMESEQCTVTPVTGVNADGEEYVTRPISGLSLDTAYEVAIGLVYAMNGTVGRVTGKPEFNGE